jgi:hypothetical protein
MTGAEQHASYLPFYACFDLGFSEGTWASKQSAKGKDFLYYFAPYFHVRCICMGYIKYYSLEYFSLSHLLVKQQKIDIYKKKLSSV